jgi:hypothetical protein
MSLYDIENSPPLTYNVLMDHNLSISIDNHIPFSLNNAIAPAFTDEQLNNELRSILIVREDEKHKDAREINKYVIRVAHTLIACLIALPIPICDLHFAYTDTSCIPDTIQTKYINLQMKLYLLLCGYISIIALAINLLSALFNLNIIHNAMIRGNNVTRPVGVLLHVYGATIFWGYIDTRHSCNNQVYNYLFVSIAIKIVGNIISNAYYLQVKFK